MTFESGSALSRDITGLHKYTAYEFQVLAFSSVGNGPKSSVQEVRTNEDGEMWKMIIMLNFSIDTQKSYEQYMYMKVSSGGNVGTDLAIRKQINMQMYGDHSNLIMG